MIDSPIWTSLLAQGIRDFLATKRALGRKFLNEEKALRLLDRFLVERDVVRLDDLTPAVIEEFLVSRHRAPARSHNHLLGVMRGLFAWLVVQGVMVASPVQVRPRRETSRSLPYLFTPDEVRALLAGAARLPDTPYATGRGRTYRMAFALLYALGLRVGEVCRLRIGDVDLARNLLLVSGTKFGKTRLVPFGPRMCSEIRTHLAERTDHGGDPEAPLFSLDGRRPLGATYLCFIFQRVADGVVASVPPGVRKPHPHCLRHSFAVATLLRWYREGVDPQQRLHHLATFLGHVDPCSTAVYLTVTAELLGEACSRFERFAAPSAVEAIR